MLALFGSFKCQAQWFAQMTAGSHIVYTWGLRNNFTHETTISTVGGQSVCLIVCLAIGLCVCVCLIVCLSIGLCVCVSDCVSSDWIVCVCV